ncbi:hypothetical protein CASFOL_037765 [Castilleja foliolosa]|uniref:Uncharacterized protein n=1 Tax=Castilleja foliolosa TaxID=1961234 RepID=A0ABD3BJK2_9LAMI
MPPLKLLSQQTIRRIESGLEDSVSYSQSMDDEYEKLIRRMNPPRSCHSDIRHLSPPPSIDPAKKKKETPRSLFLSLPIRMGVEKVRIFRSGVWDGELYKNGSSEIINWSLRANSFDAFMNILYTVKVGMISVSLYTCT